jgi:hypothetical protein
MFLLQNILKFEASSGGPNWDVMKMKIVGSSPTHGPHPPIDCISSVNEQFMVAGSSPRPLMVFASAGHSAGSIGMPREKRNGTKLINYNF